MNKPVYHKVPESYLKELVRAMDNMSTVEQNAFRKGHYDLHEAVQSLKANYLVCKEE